MAEVKVKSIECNDKRCPTHGTLSVRGRVFQGKVTKIRDKNIKIELERTVYIPKYERYLKKRTALYAHLPECMKNQISIGDIIEIGECRPLSKTIHHVVTKVAKKISGIQKEFEEIKVIENEDKKKTKPNQSNQSNQKIQEKAK